MAPRKKAQPSSGEELSLSRSTSAEYYNGKLRSAELLLREDGSVKLIRRAETPRDYFATFDFTDDFPKLKQY